MVFWGEVAQKRGEVLEMWGEVVKSTKWRRVTRLARCPCCGKSDWCGISDDGLIAHCMRQASDHPSKSGGWLHQLDGAPVKLPPKQPEAPRIDAGRLMAGFKAQDWPEKDAYLSRKLGVSVKALRAIGFAWATVHAAWAIPMKDPAGTTIGIRLRNDLGEKWSVRGSKSGLFFPDARTSADVCITEGPTDSAAAIDLGLLPVGRPSCNSSTEQVVNTLKRLGTRRVIICADADAPGIRGAELLQHDLKIPSCIFLPPAKDLRQFLNLGGTRQLFDSSVNSLVWTKP